MVHRDSWKHHDYRVYSLWSCRSDQGVEKIAPGSLERVNISIQKQIQYGRQVIADAGGPEAYDQQAREKTELKQPTLDMNTRDEIVFTA